LLIEINIYIFYKGSCISPEQFIFITPAQAGIQCFK